MRIALIVLAVLAPGLANLLAQDDPQDAPIIHPLLQQSIGYYSILLPPDYNDPDKQETSYPLCILLHGSGMSESEYLDLVTHTLKRDGVIYLTPRAPYPKLEVMLNEKKPGYTALPEYDYKGSPISIDKQFQPRDIDIEKLYTNWIAQCVQDARKQYRIQGGKFAIFGHSQGAAYAFRFAIDHPSLVKACFLADGYYGTRLQDNSAGNTLKRNHLHLVVIHNCDDPIVNFSEASNLVAYLKKNVVSFESTFYLHGEHDLTVPAKRQAKAFVDTWCRKG